MSEKSLVPKRRFKGFCGEWEEKKLSEISDVRDGTHDSPKYYTNGYPLVTSKNLTDSGLDFTDVSFIAELDYININKRSKVDIGDILFGMIGTIGNPVLVKRDDFAIKNVALIKSKGFLLNDFIIQHLKSDVFNLYVTTENVGNTQKFLSLSKIRDYRLLVPNIQEQTKIGDFFKQRDNLISLQQKKLDKLKALKQGYLFEMFPSNGESVPKRRFKGFSGEWEENKLGKMVKIKSGYSPSDFTKTDDSKGKLYIKVDDLNNSSREQYNSMIKVELHDKYTSIKKGSVIFPKRGAAILTNKVRILFVEAYMDTNMMALEPDNISEDFLYEYLSKEGLYKIADTSTIPQINNKHIEPYIILVPSINEQTKIGNFFKQLDEQINRQQRKLEKLKDIKKAYLSEMFV